MGRAYTNLPENLKPQTRRETIRSYKFDYMFNGAQLDSEIYVALKVRSGTVRALHITESARIEGEKRQELESGSKQAVPLGGRITEETTANGLNEFYDKFMGAKSNATPKPYEWRSYFYAWHEHPEYQIPGEIEQYTDDERDLQKKVKAEYGRYLTDAQLLWRRWKMEDLRNEGKTLGLSALQLFMQEYPSVLLEAFQSGSGNVFDAALVEQVQTKEPVEVLSNGLRIYVQPHRLSRYVIGADPAGGEAGDYSALAVWDQDSKEKVAEWHGHCRPDEFAEIIRDAAELYNYAFVGVENNQVSTVLFLSKLYYNIYRETTVDRKTQKRSDKLGWNTNTRTRDLMIDHFIIAFEDGSLTINSPITLNEMRTFVKDEKTGKRQHASGKHDDMLIADMIALQMMNHNNVGTFNEGYSDADPGITSGLSQRDF